MLTKSTLEYRQLLPGLITTNICISLLCSPSGLPIMSYDPAATPTSEAECIGSRRGAGDHMMHDQLPNLVGVYM